MNTVPGRPGIGTCDWCSWPNCFCCSCGRNIKKAPALTLSQARRLMEWSLPWRLRDGVYVLEIIRYHQGRNHQAYLSHRQRRLRELRQWKDLSGLPHE